MDQQNSSHVGSDEGVGSGRSEGSAFITPSSNSSDCAVVLELSSVPESVHFRAYAEPLANGSLLDWAISRLDRVFSEANGIYVVADRAEATRIEAALTISARVLVCMASGHGRLHDLGGLIHATGKPRLLFVDITAVLLPGNLFERFVRHHVNSNNQPTAMVGVPCTVPPTLVEVELLSTFVQELTSLPPALRPQDLQHALAAITRANPVADKGTNGRMGEFLPFTSDEKARRGWPRAIHLREREDVEILRRSLHLDSGSRARLGESSYPKFSHVSGVAEPLDRWNIVAGEYRKQRWANLRSRSAVLRPKQGTARRVLYAQSQPATPSRSRMTRPLPLPGTPVSTWLRNSS